MGGWRGRSAGLPDLISREKVTESSRMSIAANLALGLLLGAIGWGLGSAISGTFEPFDSGVGFLSTQIVLGTAALVVGLRAGGSGLTALLVGGYLGLNLYAYIFGGSESRAWALLGAVTTLSLVVVPLLAGLVGVVVRRVRSRSALSGQK